MEKWYCVPREEFEVEIAACADRMEDFTVSLPLRSDVSGAKFIRSMLWDGQFEYLVKGDGFGSNNAEQVARLAVLVRVWA